mgnify:FL=1
MERQPLIDLTAVLRKTANSPIPEPLPVVIGCHVLRDWLAYCETKALSQATALFDAATIELVCGSYRSPCHLESLHVACIYASAICGPYYNSDQGRFGVKLPSGRFTVAYDNRSKPFAVVMYRSEELHAIPYYMLSFDAEQD